MAGDGPAAADGIGSVREFGERLTALRDAKLSGCRHRMPVVSFEGAGPGSVKPPGSHDLQVPALAAYW